MTDEELVSKIIINKDTELFGILYDKFSKKVYNICYGFAKDADEAKDLTQDVFLKVFVKLSSFNSTAKFSTWLHSVAYNHCLNYVTRNTAKKMDNQKADYQDIYNLSIEETDNTFFETKVKKLDNALKLISTEDRMLLHYKYNEDLSIKKIEQVLGIGESAVKMRIKRAKEKVRIMCA